MTTNNVFEFFLSEKEKEKYSEHFVWKYTFSCVTEPVKENITVSNVKEYILDPDFIDTKFVWGFHEPKFVIWQRISLNM